MTVEDVRALVQRVSDNEGDSEVAHGLENALRLEVLRAIADGAENPAALAREALETQHLNFERWYA
jgi:hypothetical protein